MWLLVALAIVFVAPEGMSASGYCTTNTFPSNSTLMHFTKEPVPLEYGYADKFKSIHCCVKGYRSIEWYKDGVAYPWSGGVSNFILYPEAANQTLYTQRASTTDNGNYTCRLSNETHSETHTVILNVLEKSTDVPKTMFISKDQWIEEGSTLRLFCEALVGRSYLADARCDLRWQKVWPNGTETDLLDTHTEIKTIRDDVDEIIGSYLVMNRVSARDYGQYVCVVHSNDVVSKSYLTVHYIYVPSHDISVYWSGSSDIPWRTVCAIISLVALVILTAVACHKYCAHRLLLAARIVTARTHTPAYRARVLEKEADVLVCWAPIDTELVRGALLPTLSLKYRYRVLPQMLSAVPENWYKELLSECSRTRSLVAVLSPASMTSQQLLAALRQLTALPLPPIIVLLQDLPKLRTECKQAGCSIVSVLRSARLVPWRHVHERAFWTALRLALPLPPPVHINDGKANTEVAQDSKNSRSGSMTALV